LLLLPLLVPAFALQWPLGFRFQSPVVLHSPQRPTTGQELNHNDIPLATNPFDGQLHLPNGKHYMLDFHGVEVADLTFLETADGEAAVTQEIVNSGMTFLGSRSHLFPGGGLTAVWLLSESHLSIHTWPEHGFIALDIYTCGNSLAADRLVESMFGMLKPRSSKVSFVERGSDLSHSVQAPPVKGVETAPSFSQTPTAANPIFLGTQRPDSLVLPANIDICMNGDFEGDECNLWRNLSLLYSQRSKIQLLEVADLQSGERCLFLDAITQFCDDADNELYTRSLAERVMQPLKDAQAGNVDIYVVGGGDGWIGHHLLSAYSALIRSIRVIDIDPAVSEVTREFFPIVKGVDSFKDSRAEYIAGDAVAWLHNARDQSADAVIIDCTDHTVSFPSPPSRLFFSSTKT